MSDLTSKEGGKVDPRNYHVATMDGVEIRLVDGKGLSLTLNGECVVKPVREVHALLRTPPEAREQPATCPNCYEPLKCYWCEQPVQGKQPPEPGEAPAEYVSVGYQYRFPSIWGGHVWLDSDATHNGNRPDQTREIFIRKPQTKSGGQS